MDWREENKDEKFWSEDQMGNVSSKPTGQVRL